MGFNDRKILYNGYLVLAVVFLGVVSMTCAAHEVINVCMICRIMHWLSSSSAPL